MMRSTTVLRAGAALLATGIGGWAALGLAGPAALRLVRGPQTPEQAVTGACGLVLIGCVAWVVLVVTTAVVSGLLRLLPQRGMLRLVTRGLDRCTPAVVRSVVTAALGLSVAAGAAAPALADTTRPAPATGITGLALPDRAVGGVPVPSTARRAAAAASVVVRAGDSLWTIAEQHLPRAASDAETASAVSRLYAANRSRIGPDPDLIVPGTPLALPDLDPHHRKDRP